MPEYILLLWSNIRGQYLRSKSIAKHVALWNYPVVNDFWRKEIWSIKCTQALENDEQIRKYRSLISHLFCERIYSMKDNLTDGIMSIVIQIPGCHVISVMTEIKTRKAGVSHNKGLINVFAVLFTYFFCLFSCKEGF